MEFKSRVRYATRLYEQPVIRCYRRMHAVGFNRTAARCWSAEPVRTWAIVSLRSPCQCRLRRTVKPRSAGYSNCNDNDNPKCANCVAAALSKAVKSTLRLMSTGKHMCRTEMRCSPYAQNKVNKLQIGGRRGASPKSGGRGPPGPHGRATTGWW